MAKDTTKAAAKEETAVTTQGTKAMATFDYGEDAAEVGRLAKGFDHQTADDMAVPFLVFLQAGTPAVAACTDGSMKAGDILNSVTKQVWSNPDGVQFVAGTTRHSYTRFVPRDAGGGFKGNYEVDDPIVLKAIAKNKAENGEFGDYKTDDGDELVETFYVYGCVCSEDGEALGMAIVAFTSAKIKVYKNWISTIRAHTIMNGAGKKVNPPLFAHLNKITTVYTPSKKGNYFNPVLKPANKSVDASLLAPDDPRLLMAKACGELVASGMAKVDYGQAKDAPSVDGPALGKDGKELF